MSSPGAKVFEPLPFWFSRVGPFEDLPVPAAAELKAAREKTLRDIPFSVPVAMFNDPSPEVDEFLRLLGEYGRDGRGHQGVLSLLTKLERRHVDALFRDTGQPTAFTHLRSAILNLEDKRSGNDKHVVEFPDPPGSANGYELFPYKAVPFSLEEGQEWARIWNEACAGDLTYVEFEKLASEDMCTDWCKMDQHGNDFAGYWRSEDPAVKSRAFYLSMAANIWHLYQLPFPKQLLLKSVNVGCARRQESVRDSNFYLVVFQKYAKLAGLELKPYAQPADPDMPTLEKVVESARA